MRKGTKCDYCEDVIEYYGVKLDLGNEIYYFCDNYCMDEWSREHSHGEEIEEYEDEWSRD